MMFTEVDLMVAGMQQLTISSERLGYASILASALGGVRLETANGQLIVVNIGSSGEDGVAIDLAPATAVRTRLTSPPDPPANAALRGTVQGTMAGNPNAVLGVLALQREGSGTRVTPDFSALGASGYSVAVYSGDQLVFLGEDPQSIIIRQEGDDWWFDLQFLLWHLSWLPSANNDIEIDDGQQVWNGVADRVQFVPIAPIGTPESIERVVLQAANLESFTINELSFGPIPTCPGDLDADGDMDLDDYGVFFGCLAGPQVGPVPGCACSDLEGDGDVDLVDFAMVQLLFGP